MVKSKLNFIDTPGHVDFSYEVSRSLAACEGALLVVDAAQGVEAQSVANCYTAVELGLEVIPVLNKIDLPSAEPERVTITHCFNECAVILIYKFCVYFTVFGKHIERTIFI